MFVISPCISHAPTYSKPLHISCPHTSMPLHNPCVCLMPCVPCPISPYSTFPYLGSIASLAHPCSPTQPALSSTFAPLPYHAVALAVPLSVPSHNIKRLGFTDQFWRFRHHKPTDLLGETWGHLMTRVFKPTTISMKFLIIISNKKFPPSIIVPSGQLRLVIN
jgi:hypothetical protein